MTNVQIVYSTAKKAYTISSAATSEEAVRSKQKKGLEVKVETQEEITVAVDINSRILSEPLKALEEKYKGKGTADKITGAFNKHHIVTYADLFRYGQRLRARNSRLTFERALRDNMMGMGDTAIKILAEHLKKAGLYDAIAGQNGRTE